MRISHLILVFLLVFSLAFIKLKDKEFLSKTIDTNKTPSKKESIFSVKQEEKDNKSFDLSKLFGNRR